MPTIQNFALHDFDFPRTGKGPTRLLFPAGTAITGGKTSPSETSIDDAHLAEIKASDTAKGWFSDKGLVILDHTDPHAPTVENPKLTPTHERAPDDAPQSPEPSGLNTKAE